MKTRKILAMLLSLVMVIGLMTPAAMANEEPITSAELLTAALDKGDEVVLGGGFSTTSQFIVNGDTLDGNNYAINVFAADCDPDCVFTTTGGTIKNLTITGDSGSTRAIGSGSSGRYTLTADLNIDNVKIDNVQYAINGGGNSDVDVNVTNSVVYGWNSFSGINSFNFTNCTLGKGDCGDGYFVVYGNTSFTNCKFEGIFDIGARKDNRQRRIGSLVN